MIWVVADDRPTRKPPIADTWIIAPSYLSSAAIRESRDQALSEPAAGFKPKKSVALSGVVAGNTALCTVGRTGNDLQYRGYDILDVAEPCEFEEIAHLLIHEKLPTVAELTAYRAKLRALRGLPPALCAVLEL